ncbi:MAG: 50S ribosomal protein L3 [Planctomycetota bacterium]|nr:MAG: 50S ribosomal protein L3 [Planctomycetota bacterium]
MLHAILGKKIGMTQFFDEDGRVNPATVLQAGPCAVLAVKKAGDEKNRYTAIQLGFDERREKTTKKPQLGLFRKTGVTPKRFIKEVSWDGEGDYEPGQEVNVSILEGIEKVDVTGTTKGRGFAGVMKRYGHKGGPATHGQSDRARAPGSIGQSAYPARVFKGMKMPGHYGNVRHTIQNLKVLDIDEKQNLLIVRGAVPGPNGGYVIIRSAVKSKK